MLYAIRDMQLEDIPQVTEIDRESFPTLWPATNFKRELLHSKTLHYLVALMKEELAENAIPSDYQTKAEAESDGQKPKSKFEHLFSGVKHLFSRQEAPVATNQKIVGFAGLWFAADEAHLTTIAVREAYRRQGIGELLLISAIELAVEQNTQFITLEVRLSNTAAQALYQKYSFTTIRLRPGYYTDNREDALIMTTDRISAASFQTNFQRLKQTHS